MTIGVCKNTWSSCMTLDILLLAIFKCTHVAKRGQRLIQCTITLTTKSPKPSELPLSLHIKVCHFSVSSLIIPSEIIYNIKDKEAVYTE